MTTTSPTIPAWINLDALASPEDRERISDIRERMRAFMPQVIELARDARWAWRYEVGNGQTTDCELDDISTWFANLIGTKEINDLALLIGWLFEPDSTFGNEDQHTVAERWGDNVPGLREAVAEVSK